MFPAVSVPLCKSFHCVPIQPITINGPPLSSHPSSPPFPHSPHHRKNPWNSHLFVSSEGKNREVTGGKILANLHEDPWPARFSFCCFLSKQRQEALGSPVGETGRSRVQSLNSRAGRLSLPSSFSLASFCFLSLSPSISASPSAAVVVVCLLCSSYRLDRLAYSLVPAAPRFPHRLQTCCSSSITRGASSLVSTDLGGDRIRSTFFLSLYPFLYRLLPVRENEVPQQRLIITK